MGLCESHSYILEVVEKTMTWTWRTRIPCFNTSVSNSEQLYVSNLVYYVASTGEKRGGWPFFDDDLLCLSSKASSVRPISKERRMDSSYRVKEEPSEPFTLTQAHSLVVPSKDTYGRKLVVRYKAILYFLISFIWVAVFRRSLASQNSR